MAKEKKATQAPRAKAQAKTLTARAKAQAPRSKDQGLMGYIPYEYEWGYG